MAARDRPIVLIGPMGAGKTSVGKRVARSLGRRFVDTDKAIVKQHGPIATLFETLGEPRFREIERDTVAESLVCADGADGADRADGAVGADGGRPTAAVVSLGGGAVLDPLTRERLADALVVLLTVTPEAVEARIQGHDRPLLHHDGVAAWRAIADERAPIYASLAKLTLDTSHRPIAHVADDIVTWVGTDPA